MTASRLVVWRHGRTEWNRTHRFQGQVDIELDEVGVAEAAAAAPHVAAYRPTALVSSDLSRAAQTAAALADITGLVPVYDQDLREIHVGSWGGFSSEEIAQRHPDLHARVMAGDLEVRRGGDGETLRELADRAEKGFRRAIDRVPDGETVLVASHGLATKVGLCQLVGIGPEQWESIGSFVNCGWGVVEPNPRSGGWRITGWNLHVPQ